MAEAAPGETVVVPLRVTVEGDRADRVARDLRERLAIGEGARDGVTTHLIGEGGLNAAVLDTAQRDAAGRRATGLSRSPPDPRGCVRLDRCRSASDRPRLRRHHPQRLRHLLAVPGDRDVDLHVEHRLADRHRGGCRLLPLCPRPLSRGGLVGTRSRRGARQGHGDLRRCGDLLRRGGCDLTRGPPAGA